ncbi:MAG: hypothetical protein B6A08_01340 [Sorangiineae bacterium NIC37A_2]|jgi:sodium/bile acid cotransporter 7|nr:MAG: hypothetical protein B6A08_01340 [Sorangiineae bacterium NIC37A_2]
MKIDPYLALLGGMVALAFLFPAEGAAHVAIEFGVDAAIFGLFFLYGARLRAREVLDAMRRYPPQLLMLLTTYLVFPLLGVLTAWLLGPVLDGPWKIGILYLSVLPSTVQSSIAFTSIARGDVAAALSGATISNLLGVFLTPLLTSLVLGVGDDVPTNEGAVLAISLQILVPFGLGQLARPWLSSLLERKKRVVSWFDRGSILLIVYSAFSEGARSGVFQDVSLLEIALLLLLSGILLGIVLAFTFFVSRALGLPRGEEIAVVFCGSKKSMASGIPMAKVLFPASSLSAIVVPLMLFHQLQLFVCAFIAQKYAERAEQAVSEST